jgi:hypothetical protein
MLAFKNLYYILYIETVNFKNQSILTSILCHDLILFLLTALSGFHNYSLDFRYIKESPRRQHG